MIYTPENAWGATVHVIESGAKLERVMSVNTDAGVVECADLPLRPNLARDRVETHTLRFRSIYPIFAGQARPVTFHCYGEV